MPTLLWLKWKVGGPQTAVRWTARSSYRAKTTSDWVSTTAGRVLFIVYVECTLEKMEENHMYQHHWVFNIKYYIIEYYTIFNIEYYNIEYCSYDDSLSFYQFRCDKDCIAWIRFAEKLKGLAHNVKTIITANVPMVDFDYEKFNNATYCHVCEKPFAPNDTQVRDHCHLTGR